MTLIPYEWLCFGLSAGSAFLFAFGLLFGSSYLRRSVWVSQLLFVTAVMGTLCLVYLPGSLSPSVRSHLFGLLFRAELVLSTVATFNLVRSTNAKRSLGSIYSAFLGAVFGASLLNLLYPIDSILFMGEVILVAVSVYLGGRFLLTKKVETSGEKTLLLQLTTVLVMGFLYFWIPELSKFDDTTRFYFAFLSGAMVVATSATALSSAHERTQVVLGNFQKNAFVMERRFAKQNQVVVSLQQEIASINDQLQNEIKQHRQDSVRDHLRIRGLEESSQDIARGLLLHAKGLQEDCNQVVNETKSARFRMPYIRAYAERAHLVAQKLESIAGFLLTTEATLDNSPDSNVVFNAGDFLKECLFLCNPRFKQLSIEIEIQSLETDLFVQGKPALLAQGFLGLIYNALEATETADVRRVTLILRKVEDEGKFWVEFGISNSGPGIPTAIKSKAFHQKERDGLGIHSLGLSMAFGIFEHAGGSLVLDTDAVATTLLARLPLAPRVDEPSLRLAI